MRHGRKWDIATLAEQMDGRDYDRRVDFALLSVTFTTRLNPLHSTPLNPTPLPLRPSEMTNSHCSLAGVHSLESMMSGAAAAEAVCENGDQLCLTDSVYHELCPGYFRVARTGAWRTARAHVICSMEEGRGRRRVGKWGGSTRLAKARMEGEGRIAGKL